ncbi:hypothetical protein V8G54_002882 [Vigna mungo]|uniref:Uncharacterized protein n=1 Tax=Vigna mungo TaxID=3915 RepID=A0AAQ3PCX7_VIGMU
MFQSTVIHLLWNKISHRSNWRYYIFVILGGVVVLQFTHSQGVGTQGSPSFVWELSADNNRNAFTTVESCLSVFEAISTYLLISSAFRRGPRVESGVITKENDKTNSRVTFI